MSKIVKQVCLKYFKLCSLFLVAFFFIVFCVNLMFLVKYRTEYFNPAFDFFFKVYTGAFDGASDAFFLLFYSIANFVVFSPIAIFLIGFPSYIALRFISHQPRNINLTPVILSSLGMILFLTLDVLIT